MEWLEFLLVYVRDNGISIDPQYHDWIFRLFEKMDQAILGSGVGLEIVKQIVKVQGGRI